MKKNLHSPQGAAVLILILIIAAIGLMLSLSLGLRAISENQIGLYLSQSSRIFINMDGCAEEALIRLNRNNAYIGETLILNNTSCVISIVSSGDVRTINITASQTDYAKKLRINVILSPVFTVTSWQELTT